MHWEQDRSIKKPLMFKPGKNFQCGHHTVIEEGVEIGDNVRVGHFALVKKGTILEDDTFFDSYCVSSGNCHIGKGTHIRYQSIVARNVQIGEYCFLCAGVKTAYLDHNAQETNRPLVIGNNVFIGDNSTVLAGLEIQRDIVIGAHSLVTKGLSTSGSIYFGNPAVFKRSFTASEYDKYLKLMRGRG